MPRDRSPIVRSYIVRKSRLGGFPMDMLRAAQAYPTTSLDAILIETLIRREDTIQQLPRLVEINVTGPLEAAVSGRWESFDCEVLSASSDRHKLDGRDIVAAYAEDAAG